MPTRRGKRGGNRQQRSTSTVRLLPPQPKPHAEPEIAPLQSAASGPSNPDPQPASRVTGLQPGGGPQQFTRQDDYLLPSGEQISGNLPTNPRNYSSEELQQWGNVGEIDATGRFPAPVQPSVAVEPYPFIDDTTERIRQLTIDQDAYVQVCAELAVMDASARRLHQLGAQDNREYLLAVAQAFAALTTMYQPVFNEALRHVSIQLQEATDDPRQ